MADFLAAFERVLGEEGGYRLTNDPRDRGGMTYAGLARRSNPGWAGWSAIDAGGAPPADSVRDLYRAKYWTPLRGDEIASQPLAEALYSAYVNAGLPAVKLAQVVIGATPDGKIGPKTLAGLNAIDEARFLDRYCIAMVARYRDICLKDKSQRIYLVGWLGRALRIAA